MQNTSDPNAVAAMIERALPREPHDPLLRYQLGTALAMAGRGSEAVEHLLQAVAIKPDFADAYINLGNTLNILERPREALEAFERALALKPGNSRAAYGAGLAAQNLGRTWQAEAYFESALAALCGVPAAADRSASLH